MPDPALLASLLVARLPPTLPRQLLASPPGSAAAASFMHRSALMGGQPAHQQEQFFRDEVTFGSLKKLLIIDDHASIAAVPAKGEHARPVAAPSDQLWATPGGLSPEALSGLLEMTRDAAAAPASGSPPFPRQAYAEPTRGPDAPLDQGSCCPTPAADAPAGQSAEQHQTQETEAELQPGQPDPGPSLLYPGMCCWEDFQHLSQDTIDMYNLAVLQVPADSIDTPE